jgi:hypothetical protein
LVCVFYSFFCRLFSACLSCCCWAPIATTTTTTTAQQTAQQHVKTKNIQCGGMSLVRAYILFVGKLATGSNSFFLAISRQQQQKIPPTALSLTELQNHWTATSGILHYWYIWKIWRNVAWKTTLTTSPLPMPHNYPVLVVSSSFFFLLLLLFFFGYPTDTWRHLRAVIWVEAASKKNYTWFKKYMV